VLPVTADENRRIEVFERELWRIAVEHLDYGEQVQWAALAGARVAPTGWRRARAMLHFDQGGELKRTFLITAVDRNKNPALRLRALQEIASGRDAEAFDRALDFVESWPREDKREGVKVVLQALAEKKIGRRDQANNWIWRCANMTREVHEEYAVQRWPETKRLLGLLVNSSGGAHARNARRLVHASRQQDRRLSAALLAAAIPHTAEAGEVINGARTRMSRKPAALARELLRNFPKGRGKTKRRRTRRRGAGETVAPDAVTAVALDGAEEMVEAAPTRSRRRKAVAADPDRTGGGVRRVTIDDEPEPVVTDAEEPKRRSRSRRKPAPAAAVNGAVAEEQKPGRSRSRRKPAPAPAVNGAVAEEPKPGRSRTRRKPAPAATGPIADAAAAVEAAVAAAAAAEVEAPAPRRARARKAVAEEPDAAAAPARRTRAKKAVPEEPVAAAPERRARAKKAVPEEPVAADAAAAPAKKPAARKPAAKKAAAKPAAKKKTAAKKPAAKKTTAAKKPAAKKAAGDAPAAKRVRRKAPDPPLEDAAA
jgi:hypothetical protein